MNEDTTEVQPPAHPCDSTPSKFIIHESQHSNLSSLKRPACLQDWSFACGWKLGYQEHSQTWKQFFIMPELCVQSM